MKIYTKQGDQGQTGLFGGPRVPKDHPRIRAYGTLDELNACLGLAIAETGTTGDLGQRLRRIQGELFQLGAELATPAGKSPGIAWVAKTEIERLEHEIDAMEAELKPLKTFILPGGTRASALLHVARTVSRRAERELVSLAASEPPRPEALQYANRLSDYLFVCARYANHLSTVEDIPWEAPRQARAPRQ